MVRLGLSHPCTAFDKWRLIPVVDDADAAEPPHRRPYSHLLLDKAGNMTDLLIRDVDVVDGTGAPSYRADVLIDNGSDRRNLRPPNSFGCGQDHRTGIRVRARTGIH